MMVGVGMEMKSLGQEQRCSVNEQEPPKVRREQRRGEEGEGVIIWMLEEAQGLKRCGLEVSWSSKDTEKE